VIYGFNRETGNLIREPYYDREEDVPENVAICNVALAEFHYRHDVGVEPTLHVGAYIFAHDSEQKLLKPVIYKTVWDNHDFDRVIRFSAGETHDLIVALFRL